MDLGWTEISKLTTPALPDGCCLTMLMCGHPPSCGGAPHELWALEALTGGGLERRRVGALHEAHTICSGVPLQNAG